MLIHALNVGLHGVQPKLRVTDSAVGWVERSEAQHSEGDLTPKLVIGSQYREILFRD